MRLTWHWIENGTAYLVGVEPARLLADGSTQQRPMVRVKLTPDMMRVHTLHRHALVDATIKAANTVIANSGLKDQPALLLPLVGEAK